MKEKVIIVGDGGHAKIVIDILEQYGNIEIVGITTKQPEKKEFFGYPIIGTDEILAFYFNKGIRNVAIGIGGFTNNNLRKEIFIKIKKLGFNVISAIHPNATIASTAKLGEGVTIFGGVVINPDVVIGNNCIIATCSSIDHETIIEDHSLISAGVTVGANTIIKKGTLCALGSKIISGVTIGENSLIAAGAVVVNNIEKNTRVYGIPAKIK
ncbi:MAG: hypothetical protein A2W99_16755 [Bacteroidetes bacterium GWF2_33_16]|nr:MAG: hypothetical protein A2X00_14040 [Bacteroidetes bacterium GWE2_32_14]OFY03398.1 MAG: hypothetical protein A2W99_16755 [Bacteroidetes bacterium GWF2_33_16]